MKPGLAFHGNFLIYPEDLSSIKARPLEYNYFRLAAPDLKFLGDGKSGSHRQQLISAVTFAEELRKPRNLCRWNLILGSETKALPMEEKMTYLCPVRFSEIDQNKINEYRSYWQMLERHGCEVLVVDGSPPDVFRANQEHWSSFRHIKVDPQFKYLNGKVNGIWTGVLKARYQKIIMADDDVFYSPQDLQRMQALLDDYELVRPQNFFSPEPFYNKIDSARMLLNRADFPEGDFPGTLGFRKDTFLEAGHYDGDVLFDNEELFRHLRNSGARTRAARDFFILRRPPSLKKWLEQRPRQAYEDFVMTKRTAFSLAVIPTHLLLLLSGRKKTAGVLAASVAIAAIQKARRGRKEGAHRYISRDIPFYAPVWVLERSFSVYLALFWKITRGGYPFGDRIVKKGTGRAWKEEE